MKKYLVNAFSIQMLSGSATLRFEEVESADDWVSYIQSSPTLILGNVYTTPGVLEKVSQADIIKGLGRHENCDWGEVCKEDWELNDEALELGYRILSVYTSSNGVKFWIITEADRSYTTVLLPEEY